MPLFRLALIVSCSAMMSALGWSGSAHGQEADHPVQETVVQSERDNFRPRGRERYFDFGDRRNADFLERGFGNQLAAMQEPVLRSTPATRGQGAYVMRISFLPTFHPAYAVRIDARGDRPSVRMTGLSGAGGYEPGRVVSSQSQTVRRDLADTIAALNRATRIRDQPVSLAFGPDANGDLIICADGMHIVVELVDDSGYHMFERQECSLNPLLRDTIIAAATIAAPLPAHVRRYL